jgi:hypothetical protein
MGAVIPAKIRWVGGAGGRGKGGEVTMNSPRVGLRPETGVAGVGELARRHRVAAAAVARAPVRLGG